MANISQITLPDGTTYDLKDVDSESYAPKASPALTGTPTAPTATSGTNSTQIATTAFVQGAVSSAIGNVNSFEVSVVQSLPTTNIDPHTIYFIFNSGSTGNIYDEYMYINSNWEKIGTTDVDLSGYLAKNNTTAFTPTGDYNPATKKYVDDAMDDTYIVNFSFSEPSDVIVSDKYRDEVVLAKINEKKIIGYLDNIPYNYCGDYFYATALIDNTYPTIIFLVWDDGIPETVNTLTLHEYDVDAQAYITNVLTKTNTTSYTPTGDYNPATKKYVDDATSGITDEKLSTGTIGSGVYYPIVGTNTASATTKYIDSTGFKYDATSSTNGYARLYLGNGTASGTDGSKYGRLMIYGTTAYAVTLDSGSPTENRDISLPNKNGTIALTSDVPTKVSDLTNDSGFISSYTETDPVFSASAASGITSSDITNWNSKASNLSGLTDTTISSPTNGQVLMYNSTTSKWENTSLPIYNGGVSS